MSLHSASAPKCIVSRGLAAALAQGSKSGQAGALWLWPRHPLCRTVAPTGAPHGQGPPATQVPQSGCLFRPPSCALGFSLDSLSLENKTPRPHHLALTLASLFISWTVFSLSLIPPYYLKYTFCHLLLLPLLHLFYFFFSLFLSTTHIFHSQLQAGISLGKSGEDAICDVTSTAIFALVLNDPPLGCLAFAVHYRIISSACLYSVKATSSRSTRPRFASSESQSSARRRPNQSPNPKA